jgi:hypothetical protein
MKKLLRMFQSPAQGRSFVTVGDKRGSIHKYPSRIQYGFEFQSPAQGRSFVTERDHRVASNLVSIPCAGAVLRD